MANESCTTGELYDYLRNLLSGDSAINVVECGPDEPERWAVWVGDSSDSPSFQDIIGAGNTRREAIADAIETARQWR